MKNKGAQTGDGKVGERAILKEVTWWLERGFKVKVEPTAFHPFAYFLQAM